MLFVSKIYLCLFLPITLIGFYVLVHRKQTSAAIGWLVAASLFFYGWWNPQYLILLLGSVGFNYLLGSAMSRRKPRSRPALLGIALLGNLGLLGYYKYANFFVNTANQFTGSHFHLDTIILPLAISFFTLQQIAYVVDAYRGDAPAYPFWRYSLFVTFFPQLIAGPIVHHRRLLPQFTKSQLPGFDADNLSRGLSLFFVGMFKKVMIADQLAPWVAVAFNAPPETTLSTSQAWISTYAYHFQIYFDFSGYSDMAVGAALMFNIRLPHNFNSPFQATNIRNAWRRWHITLSDFVMRYLYAPLGANKRGALVGYRNLFIAFVATGVWHGAGWNFALFGVVHGLAVMLHQTWKNRGFSMPAWLGLLLTFNFWAWALVLFRAPDFATIGRVYAAMVDFGPLAMPDSTHLAPIAWLLILLPVVWLIPNTMTIFQAPSSQETTPRWRWSPSARWGLLIAGLAIFTVFRPIQSLQSANQAFIYFQF